VTALSGTHRFKLVVSWTYYSQSPERPAHGTSDLCFLFRTCARTLFGRQPTLLGV